MHAPHDFKYSDSRDATSIEAIVQTVEQRGESPLGQEREIEIQLEQLSSHTTSKIWSPSSAGLSAQSRQAEGKPKDIEHVAARSKGLSNKAFLKGQSHKALAERLIVLKTAWLFGNGEVHQPWLSHQDRKENLITRIDSALAAFAAEPSVKLPVGLEEIIMSEDFEFGSCLERFGLDWTKARGMARRLNGRLMGQTNTALLKKQSRKTLTERLIVLKTAWVVGNGKVPQPWFNHKDRKESLISHIHSAFAAFAAVPSVKLPVGLQKTIIAEDFDFGECLAKFGLDWTKARGMAYGKRVAHLKGQSHQRFLQLQKSGKLAGYNFIGWLKKTGELVKDACPPSPQTPIYWQKPETGKWFCFSQSALLKAVVKDAIRSVDD